MKAEEFYKQRSNSIRELWALSPKQIEYIALIMEEYGDFQTGDIYYKHEVIKAMQAYHEAKLAEITDEDIDVHIIEHYVLNSVPFCLGFTNGAKAFRDGLIKHIEA